MINNEQNPQLTIPRVRQRLFPIHMLHDGGYFEPDVNTYCQLGDGYDRGFYQGTQEWDKVTCKRCLKHKPVS
jgi:hypothetical protein